MVLLPNADVDGWWPVHAATFPVVPRCCGVVVWLFPLAVSTYVVLAGWMETMQETVAAHASWFFVLDRDLHSSSVT